MLKQLLGVKDKEIFTGGRHYTTPVFQNPKDTDEITVYEDGYKTLTVLKKDDLFYIDATEVDPDIFRPYFRYVQDNGRTGALAMSMGKDLGMSELTVMFNQFTAHNYAAGRKELSPQEAFERHEELAPLKKHEVLAPEATEIIATAANAAPGAPKL